MEGSSTREEEEVAERTATFYLYHPCYFLEEALRALLRCLGVEMGTKNVSERKEEKSSLLKTPLDADLDPITPKNSASNNHRSTPEVPTTEEEAADLPSITTRSTNASLMARPAGGPRRSGLARGSDPQHN